MERIGETLAQLTGTKVVSSPLASAMDSATPTLTTADVSCAACHDLGYVRSDAAPGHPDFGRLIKCPECSNAERVRWLRENCGLQGRALRARLANWQGGDWAGVEAKERETRIDQRRDAYRAMSRAIKDQSGLYTFWGDFGSGKSHALAIVCNELRVRMVETYYTNMAIVLDYLRDLYSRDEDTSSYWQRLLDVPVLALDEVTRFNDTGWAREKLFVLTETRYQRRDSHLTLFATNDDPRAALSTSNPVGYLFSRMREGDEVLVELRGDMRPGVTE